MRTYSHLTGPPARGGFTRSVALGILLCVALVTGCSTSSGSSSAGTSGKHYKVGVFLMVSSSLIEQMKAGFESGFLAATGWRADQVEFETENAQGDQNLVQSIARKFARADVDMIEVVGTPAVLAQAKAETKKPIIAVAMGDPVGSKVAASLEHPGGNVTGSIDYIDPSLILDEISKVQPPASKVATIYNPSNENSQVWVKALEATLAAKGLPAPVEATIASSSDVDAAARSLAGRADTIVIGPDADATSGLAPIGKHALDAKQRLFLVGGDATVPGVLASIGPDYQTLGVHAGQVAAKVALGAAPGDVPFAKPDKIEWSVNKDTAAQLGVQLPAGVG
ncbi:ABC transporter substrate-binding protein [Amycolatopsis sp. K13G38]|uniref:ABC transporter substrate-binding protein n=1 Tax=Amycolatopsis acididurans TaxID=2724524 RepID=A0ABX1JCH1_9PSEU|nr:ABC transporter substrate-binding protein [Amycolatopsis acididurans]NKQ56080.1 ABC transporter substrate-binding protein [Amycolatopsis acididurans]